MTLDYHYLSQDSMMEVPSARAKDKELQFQLTLLSNVVFCPVPDCRRNM